MPIEVPVLLARLAQPRAKGGIQPFDVGGVNQGRGSRLAQQRLDLGKGALHHAAAHLDHSAAGVALDDLRDQQAVQGRRRGCPKRPVRIGSRKTARIARR